MRARVVYGTKVNNPYIPRNNNSYVKGLATKILPFMVRE